MAQQGRKRSVQNYFPGCRSAKRYRDLRSGDGNRATQARSRLTHLHRACLAGPWRYCVNNKRAMSLTSMSSVERVGKEYLVLEFQTATSQGRRQLPFCNSAVNGK